ncbi:MAG: septum formation initiator family protein, partial [Lactobacillus sp.]|nr:septum formation initiator family protein [Lactobacillus sp.]
MNYGPHIYNSLSPEAQREQLRRKQAKIEKKTHRIRLNRIVAIFAIIFVVLGVQIAIKVSQTARINNQVKAEKENLTKAKKTANNLKTKRQNLNDPNYVAKLIRYKFYYSKSNE